MDETFAHSAPDRPSVEWETLSAHLQAVAETAAEFGGAFNWAEAARALGKLHDIGKCSEQFQAYIRSPREAGRRGGNHSIAGARIAVEAYRSVGQMLAYVIAGHHAGLADSADLDRRLRDDRNGAAPGWGAHAGAIPDLAALRPARMPKRSERPGFGNALLTRMLFSALVDADYLRTERFLAEAQGETVARGLYRGLAELAVRLRSHLADVAMDAKRADVNVLRAEVLAHATTRGRPGSRPWASERRGWHADVVTILQHNYQPPRGGPIQTGYGALGDMHHLDVPCRLFVV